ncbi:trigger factor [Gemella sp. GH3]|uniref:trigger factor n=1 Tax=unclassified Gemella TaxID=2624949 RepID=UPI0015CFEF9A|nr:MULTISPECIES: trigger factor [unclassified Gemella]MBF0714349.1 trigger factor [Gemella sp. GH3.1]NYS51301.1 trigger factor [Gemella sp. GH3]
MVEILNKEDGKVVISFSSSKEEFNKALDLAFKKIVKRVNAPGFRKGKLPRNVFNKMYGEESLYQDAIDSLLPTAYQKAIEESELNPLALPEIDVKSIDKDAGVVFEATVTVRPNVELGEYKNLDITKEEVVVSDEDVDVRIDQILSRQAEWTIKETESKKGDIVVIDFKGYVDGVAFDGGEANGYELELGSNSFIPGFEDQLVGKQADTDVEVNVTFPENYQVADLAGKDAKFEVKIHDIKEKVLPEFTDEFVKDLTKEAVSTVADYKVTLKEEMTKEKEDLAEKTYTDAIVVKAVENATINVPAKLVDQEVDQMYSNLKANLERQGLSIDLYEQFTGKTEENLKEEMRQDAEKKIKTSFTLDEIAVVEKIEATEEDINKELNNLAETYSMSVEDVKKNIGSSFDIKSEIVIKKTIDFLKENNK